ncbi:hypothetical protein ACFQ0K_14675 [Nocardioides caeni]|uniref:Uncharacterized protein n=1 Tax=Nocardioides caeni TaxID=574700 RepID=A0A4V4HKJ4_9ACTN|nr:hypothetical protein [Nocardioides caeni]THV14616.1 hypothetical protein E9934_08090 [Nocardioides caeni]
MTETQLTERIHQLAEELPAPPWGVAGDLARGRARLRRRRTTLAGGALALAVAGGAAWTAVVGDGTGTPPVTSQDRAPAAPADLPADLPADVPADLDARIQDLAVRPRTREEQLPAITVRQLQDIADVLMSRVQGPVGWLSVSVSDGWRASGADTCPQGWACEDARVRGADRARWAEAGTVHQLAVEVDGNVHVFTLDSEDQRPSAVAWDDRS